jgi:2-dehydropantoate 2-reductase
MRLLVVGAGATGGYFGGRLAQAGRDVTFLVRPARAAQLREQGLRVSSPHGDFVLAPKLITAGETAAPFDAVLLTVKAYALDAALADLAPFAGPQTMILPTLNGMKHVDILAERFGQQAVAGCVCRIAAMVAEDGGIVQLAPFHELAYGEMDGTSTARMTALDGFMQGAGFDAQLSPTIAHEMWEKWVLLAALGGVNSLMRGSIGDIVAAPGGTAFVERFLAEILAVVAAEGHAMTEAFVARARATLTAPGSKFTSSMYRDLTQGAPIEADQIVGDLVARGHRAGLATPLLDAAYTHLEVYQAGARR